MSSGELGLPISINYYDSTYQNFANTVQAQIRQEAPGEDIDQNRWLTADEYRRFFQWLGN
jgi:hypothetical protein